MDTQTRRSARLRARADDATLSAAASSNPRRRILKRKSPELDETKPVESPSKRARVEQLERELNKREAELNRREISLSQRECALESLKEQVRALIVEKDGYEQMWKEGEVKIARMSANAAAPGLDLQWLLAHLDDEYQCSLYVIPLSTFVCHTYVLVHTTRCFELMCAFPYLAYSASLTLTQG